MKCPFKSTAYVCTTSVAIAGVYRYTGVSWTEALFYRKGVQVRCTVHIANAMIVVNQLAHSLMIVVKAHRLKYNARPPNPFEVSQLALKKPR